MNISSQCADDLAAVPEVVEVLGLSGAVDLLVRVVACDADDLYRIAGCILDIDGVEKTATSLVMRALVGFRRTPLLARLTERAQANASTGGHEQTRLRSP